MYDGGMAPGFCFPLTEVKETGRLAVNARTGPETFPDALSEGTLTGPIALSGMILALGSEAAFTGTAKGDWKLECTRCLKSVEQAWSARVEMKAPINGGPMDLTEEVRNSIALAQPMRILCKPDCKGLCAVCKINRNVAECGHSSQDEGDGALDGGFINTGRPRLIPPKR